MILSHNPDQDAAAFLGGAMSQKRSIRFEQHLLECEQCWHEVAGARKGRAIGESVRELAPQSLRERIRASVETEAIPEPRIPFAWLAGAGIAVVIVLAAVGLQVRDHNSQTFVQQPEPVAQAIVDFQNRRIPAEKPASHEALNLTEIGFEIAGAGAGEIGDLEVDGFSYLDESGRRLQIYMGNRPFPEAVGAKASSGPNSPWTATAQGIEILCAEYPMTLLALSDSPGVLNEVSTYLQMR